MRPSSGAARNSSGGAPPSWDSGVDAGGLRFPPGDGASGGGVGCRGCGFPPGEGGSGRRIERRRPVRRLDQGRGPAREIDRDLRRRGRGDEAAAPIGVNLIIGALVEVLDAERNRHARRRGGAEYWGEPGRADGEVENADRAVDGIDAQHVPAGLDIPMACSLAVGARRESPSNGSRRKSTPGPCESGDRPGARPRRSGSKRRAD